MPKRWNHYTAFKTLVVQMAAKGERTVSELAAAHGVHPTMISQWKRSPKKRSATCTRKSGIWRSPTIYMRELLSSSHTACLDRGITGVMLGLCWACDPGRIKLYSAAP